MTTIDLNADLGEGITADGLSAAELDAALLDVISSANVACGGHAGDSESMSRVCRGAASRGVAIGAQVSYADRAGFGRRALDVDPKLLAQQLFSQIETLRMHARAAGTDVLYLKPHGALYNTAAEDEVVARAVVDAVLRDESAGNLVLSVLTLPGCTLAHQASAAGLAVYAEAFGDRAYTSAGRLVPRTRDGAVIHDPLDVKARVMRMIREHSITSIDGVDVTVVPDSICLHSDTEGALELARQVRESFALQGITVTAFSAAGAR